MNFEEFAQLVRSRRTSLLIDRNRDVSTEMVQQLCELSTWAPNHKLTWPWIFAEVRGEARLRLGDTCADVMSRQGEPEPRVAKTRTKFARTPIVLVVGSEIGDSDLRTIENRDAVAAAVQRQLLGYLYVCTSKASKLTNWTTPPVPASDMTTSESSSSLSQCACNLPGALASVFVLLY